MARATDYYQALIRGHRRGVLALFLRSGLWLASLGYGLAVVLRNLAFTRGWKKSERVPIPVISVGNLTTGGTGKTPCVEYIARHLRQKELQVAILSRGYGSEQGRNDEAMVLEENLPDVPHLQGADRVALAQTALEELESEILVLDDGFQHRRLARNLDIVLLDATDPWGQGYLLPRGLLREPRRGIRRANLALLTRCDQVSADTCMQLRDQLRRLAPELPVLETIHQPLDLVNSAQESAALERLQHQSVAGFCGIGNPTAFRRTLEQLGAEVRAFQSFPDHHRYNREDVDHLARWARQQSEETLLVCTQKDLVKLRCLHLGNRPLWAVRIGLQAHGGSTLQLLDEHLDRVSNAL